MSEPEEALSFYEKFMSKAKKQDEDLKNSKAEYVSMEVFKSAMELNTENMRQLYEMLHDINMEKVFSMEMDLGGIKFILAGSDANSDMVIKAAEKMIELLTSKFFTKHELKKFLDDTKRKEIDGQKIYS